MEKIDAGVFIAAMNALWNASIDAIKNMTLAVNLIEKTKGIINLFARGSQT